MTIYSLNVLLFLFGTSLLFHIQFWLLLPDLHTNFSRGGSGVLVFPSLKSLQSCPTLCNSIDGSPPDSPVPGILQARTLEWVAISFSKAWKWKVKVKLLLVTSWTAAYQTPPSIGFSRQEYWSGVPLAETLAIDNCNAPHSGCDRLMVEKGVKS